MSVGAVQYRNFEDYLTKNNLDVEVKPTVTGSTNGVPNAAIEVAREKDIFTAEKQFGSGNETEPGTQNSGAGAASSSGGNFFNNFISGTATWIVNTTTSPDSNNSPELAAASTGHTPVLQPTATPSALTGATGNEGSGPEGGSTQDPTTNVMDLYQMYLDAIQQAEVAEETGEGVSSGEGTLGAGSDGSITGPNAGDGTTPLGDGTTPPGAPAGAPPTDEPDDPALKDPANEPPEEEPPTDPAAEDTATINRLEQEAIEEARLREEQERLRLQTNEQG